MTSPVVNVPAQPDQPQHNEPETVKKPPLWKIFFGMISSPAQTIGRHLQHLHWGYAIGISGLAFGILFLQTGLDLQRAGKIENIDILYISLKGIVMGTAGVIVLAGLIWAGAKGWGYPISITDALRMMGLSFCPTLLYSLFGLAMNIGWQWNTAVAFGVTGLLWALSPVSAAVKQITNEKIVPALVLTTICGVLMLAGWAYLGGAL